MFVLQFCLDIARDADQEFPLQAEFLPPSLRVTGVSSETVVNKSDGGGNNSRSRKRVNRHVPETWCWPELTADFTRTGAIRGRTRNLLSPTVSASGE